MTKPIPALKEGEVLVKMIAAGYNRREVCISIYRLTEAIDEYYRRCGSEWGYTQESLLGVRSEPTAQESLWTADILRSRVGVEL